MDRQNNSVVAAAFPGMIEQKEEGLPGGRQPWGTPPSDGFAGRVTAAQSHSDRTRPVPLPLANLIRVQSVEP